jgi:hypothetical protein
MSLKAIFNSFAFLILILHSCENRTCVEVAGISSGEPDTIFYDTTFLPDCLAKAIDLDSANWFESDPFKSFESGYLLMDSVKHAFFVQEDETHDSLSNLSLYEQVDNEWVMIDHHPALPSISISFGLEFLDINFDGINDLFIRTACSNGYTICRGHLFEYNPVNNSLGQHPELNEFGNFSLDTTRKLLIAEELEQCNPAFRSVPVQVYFELKDGLLVEVDRKHNCN